MAGCTGWISTVERMYLKQYWPRYFVVFVSSVTILVWGVITRFNGDLTWEDVSLLLMAAYFMGSLIFFGFFSNSRALNRQHRFFYNARQGLRVTLSEKHVHARGTSIAGLMDINALVLSLASCAMYVTETYVPSLALDARWLTFEVAISLVLFLDYIIRLCFAKDVGRYICSLTGVVNVVTTVPVLVNTWAILSAGIPRGEIVGGKLTYLRLLRLLRLMRILRMMKVLQSNAVEDLRQEIFTLGFTVLCIIFAAAGLYQWLENTDDCFSPEKVPGVSLYTDAYSEVNGISGDPERYCVHFHVALYWVTIAILGRPRLIMEADSTILMLVALTLLSVIIIPLQLAGVWSAMQKTNRYQRMHYVRSARWTRHLVVVGHKEFAALNMLLYEFFHPDRGEHSVQDVVLLFPGPPERDIENLLRHSSYYGHVRYLQGSPLNEKDLERAELSTAAGVIVLANKDSDQPRWHDGELLTAIQAMKAYWLKEIVQSTPQETFRSSKEAKHYLRPRIVAQVLLPETKEYLIELPGWTDQDVVVVASEYVSWMLGMATLTPGMATLVFNLTSHTEMVKYEHTHWYPLYEHGAAMEIYNCKLSNDNLVLGYTMLHLASSLAPHHIMLVALERREENGAQLHLFPGPAGLRILPNDRIFCIARSNPWLHEVLDEMPPNYSRGFGRQTTTPRSPLRGASTASLPKRDSVSSQARSRRPSITLPQLQITAKVTEIPEIKNEKNNSMLSIAALETSGIPRGCEDVPRYAIVMDGETCSPVSLTDKPVSSPLEAPSVLVAPPEPRTMSREEVLQRLRSRTAWSGHVVLCGLLQTRADRPGGRGLFTELIDTFHHAFKLEKANEFQGVCVIDEDAEDKVADLCMLEESIMKVAVEGRLRAVSADCRNRDALLQQAMVGTAKAVVALPESVNKVLKYSTSVVDAGKAQAKTLKQILDTNTVLTMQVARGCADRVRTALVDRKHRMHCVTLLLQESASNVFFGHAQMRHCGSVISSDPRWMDISPVNMSPLFAGGELFAMTCFDRFAVEALFTPQVVPMVKMMLFGDKMGHRLYQLPLPKEHLHLRWGELRDKFIAQGRMAVGLVRFPENSMSENLLPYVITNPASDLCLQRSDLLFILGAREEDASQVDGNGYDPDSGN